MDIAIEQERKFVVLTGTAPDNAERCLINQTYLSEREPGVERRIRRILHEDDTYTYEYTEKTKTEKGDKRREKNVEITEAQYLTLLGEADPEMTEIRKVRSKFIHDGRELVHDVYLEPILGEEILEIENCELEEEIVWPADYHVMEVTGLKEFSNASIAAGKYPIEKIQALRP